MSIFKTVTIPEKKLTNENDFPVVEAHDLGVKYYLNKRREDLQSLSYKILFKKRRIEEEFWALKGVSFQGHAGDMLGVIGSNGAGKTTLCRVVSGLLKPDRGWIRVNGSITSLFSLGTGFNRELSGRENIFLNGYVLGFTRKEMKQLLPEVIAFSGLERFIDEPLKRYSSGMRARLGFSIAAMAEPEVMVIDEALSTGDYAFREKAAQKMRELVSRAKMVIVVSHQIEFIEENCTRALWFDRGTLKAGGSPAEVCSLYKAANPGHKKRRKKIELIPTSPAVSGTQAVQVDRIGVKFTMAGRAARREGKRTNPLSGIFQRREFSFWALRDISFQMNRGEILGVIGTNGAGKSTLCRVLTGILKADRGDVSVRGDTTALLSFGTGFNPEITGRDNIMLNGLMLGIPRKKLTRLTRDIIDFSGLDGFIDQPVKYYSSGMRARLGFSIATTVEPDILIIDEALNAGDASFYQKAGRRIQEMIEQSGAIIVVSHNLNFIEKICTRVLWIDRGKLLFDGPPAPAVEQYRKAAVK